MGGSAGITAYPVPVLFRWRSTVVLIFVLSLTPEASEDYIRRSPLSQVPLGTGSNRVDKKIEDEQESEDLPTLCPS